MYMYFCMYICKIKKHLNLQQCQLDMPAIRQLSTRLSWKPMFIYVYVFVCVFKICSLFLLSFCFTCASIRLRIWKTLPLWEGARVPLVAALCESVCAEVPLHSMTHNHLHINTCNYTYIEACVCEKLVVRIN